jgi:hypothetical protein
VKNIYKILVGKLEGKDHCKHTVEQEDNVEMNLVKTMLGVDCTNLAHNSD